MVNVRIPCDLVMIGPNFPGYTIGPSLNPDAWRAANDV